MTDKPATRRIYLLQPRRLSPETIAVTFAKTSRSPLSFQEIAEELSEAKSAEFHEKWVVGYGHASVAEHAVLHIAFENISRLAIECIESNRLASYTEKSTRYQKWEPGGYYMPGEVLGGRFEALYRETCDALFAAYRDSLEPVRRVVRERFPPREGESDKHWDNRVRSKYVDACRFLLPAAAYANVGMTVNARALEHAIRKMLSHPLEEVRAIGEHVREAALQETPTLVKYAQAVPYFEKMRRALTNLAADGFRPDGERMLTLLKADPSDERKALAAALFEHGSADFAQVLAGVERMSEAEHAQVVEALFAGRDRFDVPPRALEHVTYTFEGVMDQGAYFEFKRHRMMTQTPQALRADLGYAVPRLLAEAGFDRRYREAMEQAGEAYALMAGWNPHVASYIVPNGFNRRVAFTLNLREAFHFCELRSQPNAHFSIRRIALRMAEMIGEVHPALAGHMRLPEGTDWRIIEAEHFAQV